MPLVFTLWNTVPQIRKSLKTKKTDDVSIWLIICLTGVLSLWVAYGVIKGDMIIPIANAIGVSLNLCLLFLKWSYNSKLKTTTMQRK